jgi:hypothetical protein
MRWAPREGRKWQPPTRVACFQGEWLLLTGKLVTSVSPLGRLCNCWNILKKKLCRLAKWWKQDEVQSPGKRHPFLCTTASLGSTRPTSTANARAHGEETGQRRQGDGENVGPSPPGRFLWQHLPESSLLSYAPVWANCSQSFLSFLEQGAQTCHTEVVEKVLQGIMDNSSGTP